MKTKRNTQWIFLIFTLWLIPGSLFAGSADHENEGELQKNKGGFSNRNVDDGSTNLGDGNPCGVSRGDIASFANGERYNFQSVVNFVASPACAVSRSSILGGELSEGVRFNHAPFGFDVMAKGYTGLTAEEKKRIELQINEKMKVQMALNPMSNRELLPVLGQLALLSPKAARSTLAYLITQELVSQNLEGKGGLREGRDISSAVETVSILSRLGANEPLIIQELSERVEEMAATSQADSLGKVLTGLALAAREADQFASAFNSSAGAFSHGVKESIAGYSPDEKSHLLRAGLSAASVSAGYSPAIDPGAQEINEALLTLLEGKGLDQTALKNVWRKVVDVASASPGQTALAQALAISITSEAIFLPKTDREKLLMSAKTHRSVAWAIQKAFLEGWNQSNKDVIRKKMKISEFNNRKSKFFEPWVAGLLELEGASIDPDWLEEIVTKGLVKDSEIQKRFPRLVLATLEKQEELSKSAVVLDNPERWVASHMKSIELLWVLNQIYLPALEKWSKNQGDD